MKIVIYANCQGGAVAKLLRFFWSGQKDIVTEIFENYKMIDGSTSAEALHTAIHNADVFIYQPLSAEYGGLSTSETVGGVASSLKPRCTRISFPYIYNAGLWPLYPDGDEIHNGAVVSALFDRGEALVDVLAAY